MLDPIFLFIKKARLKLEEFTKKTRLKTTSSHTILRNIYRLGGTKTWLQVSSLSDARLSDTYMYVRNGTVIGSPYAFYFPLMNPLPTDICKCATVAGSCSKINELAPTVDKVSKY
jgi:hypothetical protein